MTTMRETYPKYKDSGVEWMKNIPEEWSVTKPKIIFRERKEKSTSGDVHLTPSQKYAVLPQQKYMEISGGKVVLNLIGSENMKHLERGDFVIHLRSFQGGIEYSTYAGKVSNAYTVLVPDLHVEQGFYKYVLKSHGYISELASKTDQLRDGQSIKFFTFNLVNLPKPPIICQKNIADFLDEKTKVIDELVAKKEKMIELLREKRAALITHAVTKGLNPKAKMKPSGVYWLGDIPAGWAVFPFRSLFREKYVLNANGTVKNVLSLSYGKIVDRNVESNFGLLPASFDTYQIIENGWIVFRLTDLQNDHKSLRTALSTKHGIITSAYLAVESAPSIRPNYAAYLLHAYDLYKVFYSMGGGIRQSIGYVDLKWMPILCPPVEDQDAIACHLDAVSTNTDAAILLIKSQITQLKEYRSSLIYSAVTGKIKV